MKVYPTRWDYIHPYIEGKRVLDIGPAELVGSINSAKADRWLFGRMAKVTASLDGLEQSEVQVKALSEQGYNIRQGDAEDFNLGRQFEVITAGEVIEHLSNPGRFLDCARQHLVQGGRLVLTTPNRYSVVYLFYLLRTGRVPRYEKPIAKHVLYFDSDALHSLLERHGYTNIDIGYCKWVGLPSKKRYTLWLMDLIRRFRPDFLPVLVATAQK